MKILLVEDDAVTRDYVRSGLIGAGHGVDSVEDGIDGLALALRGGHDAIILDRMLPGMDGLAILKAMRAADLSTPVLFLTAVGGLDDRVDWRRVRMIILPNRLPSRSWPRDWPR